MHIVVFPGWYPGRTDKLSGDFIQRHMYAIALYCRVSVIIPIKDSSINKEDVETITKGNLTELYYYYPSFGSIKWLDRLLSFVRYNYLCVTTALRLNKEEKVDLVHLCVLQKNHLIGFFLERLYKIPYVISEHSTSYINGGYDKMNSLQKRLLKSVFTKSASVHAVSAHLANAIKNKIQLQKDPVVIPNVVDTSLFFYNNYLTSDSITFIHVSNMSHQKNVDGMLRAFAEVKQLNSNFILNLVGHTTTTVSTLVDELGLSKNVVLWNERSYKEVAEIMQQSDVFVLFTRYETFGCVIIEANACGLPVMVSDLEVTRELVSRDFNGVFVESENVSDLAQKLLWMMNNTQKFDPLAISLQTRQKFNYEKIGEQFFKWYNLVNKAVGNRMSSDCE